MFSGEVKPSQKASWRRRCATNWNIDWVGVKGMLGENVRQVKKMIKSREVELTRTFLLALLEGS